MRGAVAAIWDDSLAVSVTGVLLVLQVTDLRPWLVTQSAQGSGWRAMVLSDDDLFICGALLPDAADSLAALRMRKGIEVCFTELKFRVRGAHRFPLA